MEVVKIVSPLNNTRLSVFTLRIKYSDKVEPEDTLAVYIKDNLFLEQEIVNEIKIRTLPLEDNEVFDIALAVIRNKTVVGTTKGGPYQYKKPVVEGIPLSTILDNQVKQIDLEDLMNNFIVANYIKDKVTYYTTKVTSKIPENATNVLVLPSDETYQGEVIFLILPTGEETKKLVVVNSSKSIVNMVLTENHSKVVRKLSRYSMTELQYSDNWN